MRGGDGVSEKAKFDQSKYAASYNKEHYELVRVRFRKEANYSDRIKAAAERAGLSVNQWIIKAIDKELEWYE